MIYLSPAYLSVASFTGMVLSTLAYNAKVATLCNRYDAYQKFAERINNLSTRIYWDRHPIPSGFVEEWEAKCRIWYYARNVLAGASALNVIWWRISQA